MFKPSNYLILSAFLITLGIYRIPTPLGLTIDSFQIFLGLALSLGVLAFLSGTFKREIDKDTKSLLLIFCLYMTYSFVSFLINAARMKPESRAFYYAELVGYATVLAIPILINKTKDLQKVIKAFALSSGFVFLGACWHLYNYYVLGQLVSDVPFWHNYSQSTSVLEYMADAKTFDLLPRFTLPFGTPAEAGIYLSLAGILLLALTLYRITYNKRGIWILIIFNFLNFFCLLGTFARASWGVFLVGSLVVLWYFKKMKLIRFRKFISPLLIFLSLAVFFNLTPIGNEFIMSVGLRFDLEKTAMTDESHLETRLLALEYWAESPIVGLGIGGYFLKPFSGVHTHSTYFTILADRGLIGLLLYSGFIFRAFILLIRRIGLLSETHDDNMLPYIVGLLGCLSGLFVGNFLYEMNTEGTWLLFGLILGCVRLAQKNPISLRIFHKEQRIANKVIGI